VSSLNHAAGQTRANNGVVAFGTAGQFDIYCAQASGSANAVVDITGYFK
jgi:hypothetical protein